MGRAIAAWIRALVAALMMTPGGAMAQQPGGFSALARVDPVASHLVALDEGVALDLALSRAVPWRLRYLAAPPRVVVDFRTVDFAALDPAALLGTMRAPVSALRAGAVHGGWSRLVLTLDRPLLAQSAELRTGQGPDGTALLRLRLLPAAAADFAAAAARPDPPGWALPEPAATAPPRPPGGPLVVMLDPGHGGLDPGAEHGGHRESDLMLTFARELREALLRHDGIAVQLTRNDDSFVPLETRIALAHQAGADLFISLHADAVPEGVARGATIYTLAATASDAASAALAERHDRDALLAGVDLTGQDDMIAGVLMDLARTDTAPRTEQLAAALVTSLRDGGWPIHRTPHRHAAFSVLKAPDIPSVLVELAYMSSPRDLARLTDPAARAEVVAALVAGIKAWALADAAAAGLRRQ